MNPQKDSKNERTRDLLHFRYRYGLTPITLDFETLGKVLLKLRVFKAAQLEATQTFLSDSSPCPLKVGKKTHD